MQSIFLDRLPHQVSSPSPLHQKEDDEEEKLFITDNTDSFKITDRTYTVSKEDNVQNSLSAVTFVEELVYRDEQFNISLLETRHPPPKVSDEAPSLYSSSTSLPSLTSMLSLASQDIRAGLAAFDDVAASGPVTPSTRRAQLIRLKKLRLGLCEPTRRGDGEGKKTYPWPVEQSRSDLSTIRDRLHEWRLLDEMLKESFLRFDGETKRELNLVTREGLCRSSFNYLLLDPRLTRNLPLDSAALSEEESAWDTFLSAVFYVGKGTRARPLAHLYEAVKKHGREEDSSSIGCPKTRTILDIWREGKGVVCLQVFGHSFQAEALSREAGMIEALGKIDSCFFSIIVHRGICFFFFQV